MIILWFSTQAQRDYFKASVPASHIILTMTQSAENTRERAVEFKGSNHCGLFFPYAKLIEQPRLPFGGTCVQKFVTHVGPTW